MKRIGAFSLAIIVFALSIIVYLPDITFADDDKTVLSFTFKQLNHSVGAGMSASDASAVVTAHKDIYTSDGKLLFIYNPSNSYNWTTSTEAYYLTLNYSDEQLKNIFMSKNPLSTIFNVWGAALSNNNGFRALCSGLGIIFTKNSDAGTKILDTLSGNYNYLDSLNYDEDSQTITMSNNNGSVDKLREEIRKYYYKDNGMFYIGGSLNKPTDIIKSSWYDDMTLYQEDYNAVSNYDFAIGSDKNAFYFNSSDYSYIYLYLKSDSYFGSGNPYNNASVWWQFTDNNLNPVTLPNYTKSLNCTEYTSTKEYNMNYNEYAFRFYTWYSSNVRGNYSERLLNNIKERVCIDTASTSYGINPYIQWKTENLTDNSYYDYISSSFFYSNSNKTFVGFTSYEALFNYVHGESSAYLGSAINKVGEDITFSIKDMNENIGSKMDTLIDSINDKKGSMSADELQNAIDKGIEDLNKNTEDIKDNTSSILDKLEEQNQILLQILGVTEYIAYQTTKDDGSSYTKTDLTNTINKIYNGLCNAILYGKNTLTDSGDNSGAASQSYIVTREDFKLSNNIYTSSGSGVSPGTPVVAYSLDDCSVYDDSNDYDVGIATQDINNMDIHDGLFGKFPFSVPYQLYEWLQVLQADPVAPKLVYNYGFLLGHKGEQKYDLTIDLSIYEPWANVCKSFLRLSFTLAMSLFLYKKFKGNSIF